MELSLSSNSPGQFKKAAHNLENLIMRRVDILIGGTCTHIATLVG